MDRFVDCELLFVYGSLRRGFAAQSLMRRVGARYLCEASARGRLFSLGEFLGAMKAPRASGLVPGELYYLPNASRALKPLDRYEGSRYKREVTQVELQSGKRVQAWIYWLKQATASRNQSEGGTTPAQKKA